MNDDTSHRSSGQYSSAAEGEPHRRTVDVGSDSVSETLIETIASLDGAEPSELAVLARFVDPDALDALFRPGSDGVARPAAGAVEFEYEGYRVRVGADGEILVSGGADAD